MEIIWKGIAKIAARPAIAAWLIQRAQRTPYWHLEGYMERWWLFNAVEEPKADDTKRWPWLPSIRIHHILRGDEDRHLHNHPWNARTIILRGWYIEQRMYGLHANDGTPACGMQIRKPGDTAKIGARDFHKITQVSTGGVWTLFITWKKAGIWGFKTEGGFVPSREYFNKERI